MKLIYNYNNYITEITDYTAHSAKGKEIPVCQRARGRGDAVGFRL